MTTTPRYYLVPKDDPGTPKAPKEPDAATRDALDQIFKGGALLTKRKAHELLDRLGTDTIDNAIDWMAANGTLTREKKTYRAAKAKEAQS